MSDKKESLATNVDLEGEMGLGRRLVSNCFPEPRIGVRHSLTLKSERISV